jgi:RsiW-degrading membrane proteinase PrsW (M82 family)
MMDITYFSELLLLSFLLSSFMFLFRPRVISVIIGGSIVAFAAIMAENYVLDWTSDLFLLLIAAPVIEEILKLLATIHGKEVRNAIGVGMGFAIVENAFYLAAVLSLYSLNAAIPFIVARAIGDPLLHSSAASISVRSWKGSRSALPKAIGLHVLYNLWAVIITSFPELFKFEPIAIVLLLALISFETGTMGRLLDIRIRKKVNYELKEED